MTNWMTRAKIAEGELRGHKLQVEKLRGYVTSLRNQLAHVNDIGTVRKATVRAENAEAKVKRLEDVVARLAPECHECEGDTLAILKDGTVCTSEGCPIWVGIGPPGAG